ncbi:hypothetical protein YC2023_082311 [Brassica napus]
MHQWHITFLYQFLDNAEVTREKEKNDKWDRLVESWHIKRKDQIPRQLLDYIMVEGNKQHGSEELSRAEGAETSYPTSTSIDTSTATSIDSTTSMSTNGTTSKLIDGTTSKSIAHTIPTSIDRDSYRVVLMTLQTRHWRAQIYQAVILPQMEIEKSQ